MKIIPVYLPQFHCIPENDEWWGNGFTEWVNVKGAKPLFPGHKQPRVPLNNNYYDLSDIKTLKWQCDLANKYGIYGFCFYHYWFNGHLLLEKPMEMLLAHPEININYCISWANHDWNDSWKATEGRVRTLISHNFDDEQDWVDHFNYMLPFFKDKRYMKEENSPLLVIYIPQIIGKLNKMLNLWEKMAQENGFSGMKYIYQSVTACMDNSWDKSKFSYGIQFNPGYVQYKTGSFLNRWKFSFIVKYSRILKKFFHINKSLIKGNSKLKLVDYDEDWKKVLNLRPENNKMIPSAMVDWDNSPRKGNRGWAYKGASPEKFRVYFQNLVENAKKYYSTDMIFIFAWNEWAEGGYLEPDSVNKYGYLEAIRDVISKDSDFK